MASQPFTILMADDDLEDLELMEEAIRKVRSDLHFHTVTNGNAVLGYLEKQTDERLPCLIILDYNMPQLNGAEVLSELCKHPRYISIVKIIFSTSNAPFHIKECKDYGAAEYFVKPTNMQDLDSIVRKLMTYCIV
jgi:CheY-like chemotaxis protein